MKPLKIAVVAAALGFAALSVLTSPAQAQERIRCNWDPVCQAKRDGISVSEATQRNKADLACMRKAGFTRAQWRAQSVDDGRANVYRTCIANAR